jgi:hypothetical protein
MAKGKRNERNERKATFVPAVFIAQSKKVRHIGRSERLTFDVGLTDSPHNDFFAVDRCGQSVTVVLPGTYRFDLNMNIIPYSEVSHATVKFESPDFDAAAAEFSETRVEVSMSQAHEGRVQINTSTILPLAANQQISVKFQAAEKCVVLVGARLMITRVG